MKAPVLHRMGRAHWEGGGGSAGMRKQWRQVSLQKRKEPVGKAARYLKGLNRKVGPRKEQRRWPLVMGKDGRLSKRDQNNVGKPFQGKGLPGKTMPWAPAWKG